jgi:hypothetical protein
VFPRDCSCCEYRKIRRSFHRLLHPSCRPLPATGSSPARSRPATPRQAQAAAAAWLGAAGVGAAEGGRLCSRRPARCPAAHAPTQQRRVECHDQPSESNHPWGPLAVALPLPPSVGSIKAKNWRLRDTPLQSTPPSQVVTYYVIIFFVFKRVCGDGEVTSSRRISRQGSGVDHDYMGRLLLRGQIARAGEAWSCTSPHADITQKPSTVVYAGSCCPCQRSPPRVHEGQTASHAGRVGEQHQQKSEQQAPGQIANEKWHATSPCQDDGAPHRPWRLVVVFRSGPDPGEPGLRSDREEAREARQGHATQRPQDSVKLRGRGWPWGERGNGEPHYWHGVCGLPAAEPAWIMWSL